MFNVINTGGNLVITMPQWVWAILAVFFVLGVLNMFRRGGIRH